MALTQVEGNCVVVRRGEKEAGGEVATVRTHGAPDRFGFGGLRVLRRPGPGEPAPLWQARAHQGTVS